MDPITLKIGQLNAGQYFREPFDAICHQKQLREFMVMNIEPVYNQDKQYGSYSHKHQLADVWVLPVNSLGGYQLSFYLASFSNSLDMYSLTLRP